MVTLENLYGLIIDVTVAQRRYTVNCSASFPHYQLQSWNKHVRLAYNNQKLFAVFCKYWVYSHSFMRTYWAFMDSYLYPSSQIPSDSAERMDFAAKNSVLQRCLANVYQIANLLSNGWSHILHLCWKDCTFFVNLKKILWSKD